MKNYNKVIAIAFIAIVIIFLLVNIIMINIETNDGRLYRVEANRMAEQILEQGFDSIDVSEYSCIKNVYILNGDEKNFFEGSNSDYLIKEINGDYYRFDYSDDEDNYKREIIAIVNIVIGIVSVFTIAVMFYVRHMLLKPFDVLKEAPYELSKGNLTIPLKENKNRFFGRFIWGMDMLRENIEEQHKKELELQKDKKTLILSISHDIKTPLSAIKLYSKALSRNLYNDAEKQFEIAEKINLKADEIEDFVSQIIKASNEDFLQLEVTNDEFYLSELINSIKAYYGEKLSLLHMDFQVDEYLNCLLKGDVNRSVEVIQNIMENAVKYGDGHRIKITFSEEEDCCLITVLNSGCSLNENELPHIFDGFWRGSNTGNNSGSGLGLYICRQLMIKMDGDIFARICGDEMLVTIVIHKV